MSTREIPYKEIEEVRNGALLLKFGRHGTPQFRTFQLTNDLLYLTWQSKRKASGNSRVPLADCKLVEGQHSAVFKRHDRRDLSHVSFTLEVAGVGLESKPSRTLDIACKSEPEYQTWVTALSFLCLHGPPSQIQLQEYRTFRTHDHPCIPKVKKELQSSEDLDSLNANRNGIESLHQTTDKNSVQKRTARNSKRHTRSPTSVRGVLRAGMKDTNDIYVWGSGGWGQLGIVFGAKESQEHYFREEPVLVEALLGKGILSVSCGDNHSAAVSTDGQLFTWGNGGSGRLGLGHTNCVLEPVPVPMKNSAGRFVMVSCGALHTLALTATGHVYAWGSGADGRLGLGDLADRTEPVYIPLVREQHVTASAVAASACTSAAVAGSALDGNWLYTWGASECGLLGRPLQPGEGFDWLPGLVSKFTQSEGSSTVIASAPWEMERTASSVATVALGSFHAGLLTTAGECFTWGWGGSGALGHGDLEDRARPTRVQALQGKLVRCLDCGGSHTAAVVSSHNAPSERVVYTWGSSRTGQLGHGPDSSVVRVRDESLNGEVKLDVDEALRTENAAGHTTLDGCLMVPQQVHGLRDVVIEVVACGEGHTMAVSETGQAYGWGRLLIRVSTNSNNGVECAFEPVLIPNLQGKEVRGVSCGVQHTCVTVAKEWISDKETKACMQCKSSFTFVNRRHHCRNCGGIYCSKCSSKRHAVLKLGHIIPVRVCDSCYNDLGVAAPRNDEDGNRRKP